MLAKLRPRCYRLPTTVNGTHAARGNCLSLQNHRTSHVSNAAIRVAACCRQPRSLSGSTPIVEARVDVSRQRRTRSPRSIYKSLASKHDPESDTTKPAARILIKHLQYPRSVVDVQRLCDNLPLICVPFRQQENFYRIIIRRQRTNMVAPNEVAVVATDNPKDSMSLLTSIQG